MNAAGLVCAKQTRHSVAIIVFGSLISLFAIAQPHDASAAPADLESQAQECLRLARSGDRAAANACQQKMMKAVQAAMSEPEGMRRMQQESQGRNKAAEKETQPAAPATSQAAQTKHQRARDCTTLSSRSRGSAGDRSGRGSGKAGESVYGYGFTNACDQPVTVHLCLADGPQQSSRKRQARLQPGESVRWEFAKRGKYSPLTVHDACFEADQCTSPPGPVACREP